MIVNVSCRIRVLTEQIEDESKDLAADQSKDVLAQKEEMIKCLQSELIKVGNFTTICIPAFQLNYILMNFVKVEIG